MQPCRFVVALACVASICAASAARAHDTWLLPSSAAVPVTTRVEIAMTSGMAFPRSETAIDPSRVAVASARIAGATTQLDAGTKGSDATSFVVRPQAIGVATIWVELHPRTLELTAEQVKEYLDEIGAPAGVRERYEKLSPPRRWRESYVKHAKTYVRSGEPTTDASWGEPVGMAFELVPAQDPTTLRAGGEVTFRLLRGGAPAAGLAVGLLRESGEPILRTTDADGRVTFPLAVAGRYLARATELRAAKTPELDWESDFTTLTFSVK